MTLTRLRWNGNVEAQQQADLAYSRLKPKKRRKPKGKKKHSQAKLCDPAVAEFMALVQCERREVLDSAEQAPIRKAAAKGPESQTIYFGKHKGSLLSDVPSDYLRWACQVKDAKGSFRKFQQIAEAELARRQDEAVDKYIAQRTSEHCPPKENP